MRVVQRRFTRPRRRLPKPPWDHRMTWSHKAPRVCLTNMTSPVMIHRGGTVAPAGEWDHLLRLYQHTGFSKQSVRQNIDGVDSITYDLYEEWTALISRDLLWIEYVDNPNETCWRITYDKAQQYGHEIDTEYGPMWAIPITHYTKAEPDHDKY